MNLISCEATLSWTGLHIQSRSSTLGTWKLFAYFVSMIVHYSGISKMLALYYTIPTFNSLPDDKILDWPKFKQIADDTLKCRQALVFTCLQYKSFCKHCGERRNCWLRAISPFPSVFSTCLDNFLPFSSNPEIVVCKLLEFGRV